MTEQDKSLTPTRVGSHDGLGPLPPGEVDVWFNGVRVQPAFTAEQMRAYAAAEVARAQETLRKGWVKIEMVGKLPARALWPECSGDPKSCPENEGAGCCKA